MTSAKFNFAVDRILEFEGGAYVADDMGSPARWGVRQKTLDAWHRDNPKSGLSSSVRRLKREEAAAIYKAMYWDKVRGDDLPGALAFQAFDTAVQFGPERAARMLQRAIGTVEVDGIVGPATIAAAHGLEDPMAAVRAINGLRLEGYKKNPQAKRFMRGWTERMAAVEGIAAGIDQPTRLAGAPGARGRPGETQIAANAPDARGRPTGEAEDEIAAAAPTISASGPVGQRATPPGWPGPEAQQSSPGFWFDEHNAGSVFQRDFAPGAVVPMGMAPFLAGFNEIRDSHLSTSETEGLRRHYGALTDALNVDLAPDRRLMNPYAAMADLRPPGRLGPTPGRAVMEREIWDEIRGRGAGFAKDNELPANREEIYARLRPEVEAVRAGARAVEEMATAGGRTALEAGRALAYLTDPIMLMTLPLGAPWAAGVARTMIIEGIIGGVTQTAIEPAVEAYMGRLKIEYTDEDYWNAIVSAGLGSAVFGGAVKGVIKAGGALLAHLRAGPTREAVQAAIDAGDGNALLKAVLEAPRDDLLDMMPAAGMPAAMPAGRSGAAGASPSTELRAARAAIELEAAHERAAPVNTAAGQIEHDRRAAETLGGLLDDDGFPAAPGQSTGIAAGRPEPLAEVRARQPAEIANGIALRWFKTDELGLRPAELQYKAGTDAQGLSEALRGLEKWDDILAGDLLVWEDLAGKFWVADGHQRYGLARRLEAGGHAPISLKAFVLREADGITIADARVMAAGKNIAAGSGTAIDAAKILRDAGAERLTLPPRSEKVRQARALARLGDDGWGMVVNEVLPAHYAAVVGHLVDDKAAQPAVLDLLAKAQPANMVEAEAMVRQALAAGFRAETQMGLFGAETIQRGLFKERAKIVDRVLKALRAEGKVFETLVREESRISGAGNVLAREENVRRAQTDAIATAIVQKLGSRAGPVSDAITAAAREAAESGQYAGPVNRVIDAIRGAAGRGDLDGLSLGRDGSLGDVAGAHGQMAAEPSERVTEPAAEKLEAFSEPAGKGQEEQVERLAAEAKATAIQPRAPVRLEYPGQQEELITLRDQARQAIEDRDWPTINELIREAQGDADLETLRRALDEAGFNPDRYIGKTQFSPAKNKTLSVEEMEGAIEPKPQRAEDSGGQAVIPGAERISDKDLAERKLAEPLKARGEQAAADEGLFDVAGRGQGDMFTMVERVNDAGEAVPTPLTRADVLKEIEDDKAFLAALEACK